MVSIERRLKRGPYEHTTAEWMDIVAGHAVVKRGEWFKSYEISREIGVGEARLREILELMVRRGRSDKKFTGGDNGIRKGIEYRLRRKNWITEPWGKIQPARVGPMEWARNDY